MVHALRSEASPTNNRCNSEAIWLRINQHLLVLSYLSLKNEEIHSIYKLKLIIYKEEIYLYISLMVHIYRHLCRSHFMSDSDIQTKKLRFWCMPSLLGPNLCYYCCYSIDKGIGAKASLAPIQTHDIGNVSICPGIYAYLATKSVYE